MLYEQKYAINGEQLNTPFSCRSLPTCGKPSVPPRAAAAAWVCGGRRA